MAAATAAWAAGEWLRGRSTSSSHASRWWAIGAAFALVHAVAAFAMFYGWSQRVALERIAAQTAQLTGLSWGGGLYLNYLFLVVWTADAAWWMASPASFARRRRWIDRLTRGFLFFMFVNGGVVFADGWMQAIGGAAVAAVTLAWYREWRST